MRFDELDLDALIESDEVEAKAAQGKDKKGEIPKSMWKAYSAFANSYGGWILLGVKEHDDKSFEYLGVPHPEKMMDDLVTLLEDKEVVSHNVLGRDDLFIKEHGGVRIVVLRVPPVGRSQRPVFRGSDPYNGTHKRIRDSNPQCTRDEVQRMFADAAASPPSSSIVEDYTIDDLDLDTIARFRRRVRDVDPDSELLDEDDEKMLIGLGALRKERKTKTLGVTLAGLLVFGRWISIRDHLPYYHLDYQEYLSGQDRWSHRIHTDGTWSGNLYDFYTKVIRRLYDGLDVPFVMKGDMRVDNTPVHDALREAIANTLSHADHTSSRSIVIEKWPQKYIFRNPGRLRVPLEKIYEGSHTDPRNPLVHQMFISLGITERAGRGIPKILSAWKKQHWRRPLLSEDLEMEQTQLTLHRASLLPQDAVEQVEQLVGQKVFESLSHQQRIILVTVCADREVTHAQLNPLLDLHPRDLTLELQRFVDQGYIVRQGQKGGRSYKMRPLENTDQLTLPQGSTSSPDKRTSSQHSGESSQHSDENSQHNGESSQHSDGSSLSLRLTEIASRIRDKGRVSPATMRSTISELCDVKPLTLTELAVLLNRAETYLQNHVLRLMIKDEELVFLHPTPTHPQQRYVVHKSAEDVDLFSS